jgi:hypothetical protein
MDSALLVMSLLAVSGALGLGLAWVITSLIFILVLRRPLDQRPQAACPSTYQTTMMLNGTPNSQAAM